MDVTFLILFSLALYNLCYSDAACDLSNMAFLCVSSEGSE